MANAARGLLVRGRWVVTGAGKEDATIADGAVLVHGGRVDEVGPWSALRARHPEADVLGSDEVAVIPGLVSAHHHSSGVTATQQGILDDVLELWILEMRRVRPGDPYLDALLASARLLRSGVTSFVEMHQCRGPAGACEGRIRQALRGYEQAGIRVAFAPGVSNQNQLVSGASAAEVGRFLEALPPDARQAAEAMLPGPGDMQPDEYFGLMDMLWKEYGAHPRIDIWFGPPGPYWVSDDFMARIGERAAACGTGIQTHLSESLYEKLYGPRTYGKSAILHLQALGVLSPRFSVAHAVWLTEAEVPSWRRRGRRSATTRARISGCAPESRPSTPWSRRGSRSDLGSTGAASTTTTICSARCAWRSSCSAGPPWDRRRSSRARRSLSPRPGAPGSSGSRIDWAGWRRATRPISCWSTLPESRGHGSLRRSNPETF